MKFSRKLKAAGVPDRQAEAEAEALAEMFSASAREMATKADLREMELRIESELKLHRWILTFVAVAIVIPLFKELFL